MLQKKEGGGFFKMYVWLLQAGIMSHTFSLNWQKDKRSNLKLSFTVVHNMECDEC